MPYATCAFFSFSVPSLAAFFCVTCTRRVRLLSPGHWFLFHFLTEALTSNQAKPHTAETADDFTIGLAVIAWAKTFKCQRSKPRDKTKFVIGETNIESRPLESTRELHGDVNHDVTERKST